MLSASLLFTAGNSDAQQSYTDFAIDDSSFAENVGNATFDMTRRRAGSTPFIVNVSVHNGTGSNAATLNSDFRDLTSSAGTKSFTLGTVPRTITIPIINDTAREDDEVFIFRVQILGPGGSTVNVPITIEKNDQPPASLSISPASNVQITEGGTQIFTVTLNPVSAQTVTVKCSSVDGGAEAPEDYTEVDETLTFAPGETAKTCSLVTIDDQVDEPATTETVVFGLVDAKGGDVETDGSGGVSVATGHDTFLVTI